MFQYRDATFADFNQIASFPQSEQELCYMYPKGKYPLNAEQLAEAAAERKSLTVVTDSDEVVAYGNLYNVIVGTECWIGNVIVQPQSRGTGVACLLIQSLMNRAAEEHLVKTVHLVCHNTNTRALFFYQKLGFTPYEIMLVEGYNTEKVAGIKMRIAVEGQVTL
ncbi:GNAT family N-acetyltransferase [Cohnella sp. WQ 127256]|uniref:GNAT family N-acetyltransferase n=1 Tax=Cohnella sp. WQ 127256 TaxID=2938790 RepID=UPI002117E167